MPETFHANLLIRPEILDLEEYSPIQPFEVLSQQLGMDALQIVKLDANENPYGPLPAVREALAEYPFYHIYPDPQQTKLREALSDYVGVPPENIFPSHGADEMLDYLCRLFLAVGERVINCPPTFGMYSFDTGNVGGSVVDVGRRDDFSVDVEGIEEVLRRSMSRGEAAPPKILFLTSPNNPSGNWLSDDDLTRLLALPVLVVLDEAYVEFADEASRSRWVMGHDNLVVLRTFSKAAGIAGLRLGYGICSSWLMRQLWKFKQPYNVNVAAAIAGLASLGHIDQLVSVVEKIKAERTRLVGKLEQITYLHPYPTMANFVLCDVAGQNAAELKLTLERSGILVRYYDKPRLRNCIRISVGRPEHTDRLIEALQRFE